MSDALVLQNQPSRKLGAFEKRIHEIDFIRGFLMILVILDHLFLRFAQYGRTWFEITNNPMFQALYQFGDFYWDSVARSLIRPIALFGFTFISGISCAFSKDNWKRAGLMVLVYVGVLVVTNIMDATMGGGMRIDFNVIGVLAFSTLIYCFFQKKTWKSISAMVLIFSLVTIVIIPLLLTIPNMTKAYVPFLWSTDSIRSYWDFNTLSFRYISYPNPAFTTLGIHAGDHMPLFPYIVFFFLGALISIFVYKNKKSVFKNRYEFERPVCFIGRHAIWFYLLHQVVFLPVFELITLIIRNG
jgi:uncharacterized membrane protein